MLYQLPNGDWIDPATVTDVRYGEPVDVHSPRVLVGYCVGGNENTCVVHFDTPEAAKGFRDLFADVCNDAKGLITPFVVEDRDCGPGR